MTRYALIYGVLAGLVIIMTVVAGLAMANADTNWTAAEWMGYLSMLVALSLIFVGVKRFRDQQCEGFISFWRALSMGLSIALVAAVIYVAVWEVYLFATDYEFIGNYTAGIVAASEADGLGPMEMDELRAKMADMELQYANVLYRLPMTFLEIFPVGLLIALIAAGVLRRVRPQSLYQEA